MKKIEFRSNWYVFEGGGVIIEKVYQYFNKEKTYSKRHYSVIQFIFFVTRYFGYTFYGQQSYKIIIVKK